MKFIVTIQTALPVQSGTSKSGKAWSKQTLVGVYDSSNPQYPKSIVFDVMGDNINKFNLQPGGQYEVEIDFTAREWQDRWYMSANCWKATAIQAQMYGQPNAQQPYPAQAPQQNYSQQPYPGAPQPQAYPPNAQPYNPQYAQSAQAAPAEYADDLPF